MALCYYHFRENGKLSQPARQDNRPTLAYRCPAHGRQTTRLDDPAAVIDANIPIRTVLRSLCFARDRDEHAAETVVLNGAANSSASASPSDQPAAADTSCQHSRRIIGHRPGVRARQA